MKRFFLISLLVFGFGLLALASRPAPAAPPVTASPANLAVVLRSGKYPFTVKASSLNSSWRKFDTSKNESNLLARALGRASDRALIPIYYTRGQIVKLGSQDYLVAYYDKIPAPSGRGGDDEASPVQDLTKLDRKAILHITLLNLSAIGSLEGLSIFNPASDFLSAKASLPDPIRESVRNLRSIGLAMLQYTQDYDEMLPPMKSAPSPQVMMSHLSLDSGYVQRSLWDYCKSYKIFIHPQTHQLYKPNLKLSGTNETSYQDHQSVVTFYEPVPASDGLRAVLFLDGHVARLTEAEWAVARSLNSIP
jgi:prepilin-type processing-associated H-X9-DG protein